MRFVTLLAVILTCSTSFAQYCGPNGCGSGFGLGLGFYDSYCPPPVVYRPYPVPDQTDYRVPLTRSPLPRKQINPSSQRDDQVYVTKERYERDVDIYNANAKHITKRLDELASSQEDLNLKMKYLHSNIKAIQTQLKNQSANDNPGISPSELKTLLSKLDSLSAELKYVKQDLSDIKNQSTLSSNQKDRTLPSDPLYFKIEESPTP